MLDQSAQPEGVFANEMEGAGDTVSRVSSEELRSFVERVERLNSEKQAVSDQIKEVLSEAKSRGYMIMAIRKIVALRKRDADDVAEEEAIIELYKSALGM